MSAPPPQHPQTYTHRQQDPAREIKKVDGLGIATLLYAAFMLLLLTGFAALSLFGMRFIDRFAPGKTPEAIDKIEFSLIFYAVVFAGFGVVQTIALIYAAIFLKRRTNFHYCMAAFAVMVLAVPFGTVLGIAGLVILKRPVIREVFENESLKRELASRELAHA
jgi:hypothetical protein